MLIKNEFKPRMAENTKFKMPKTMNNSRLGLLLFLIGIVMCVFVTGGWFRKENKKVFNQSTNLVYGTLREPALRGEIVDRNGVVLAASRHLKVATFNPQAIYTPKNKKGQIDWNIITDEQFAQLAQILKMPEQEVRAKLQDTSSQYALFKTQLTLSETEALKALKIPTLHFEERTERTYPTGRLFSHIIGFSNSKGKGLAGLENSKDALLSGQDGAYETLKDAAGRVVSVLDSSENITVSNGQTLRLSVDYDIQRLAHDELSKALKTFNAKAGGVVVLDAQNGEILAISSLPDYDANSYQNYPDEFYKNYAVSEMAEPGSVMKPFIIAKALDEGKIHRGSYFNTQSYKLGGYTIKDTHEYASLNVEGILQKSSNVGTSRIAAMLDNQELYNYLSLAGFGRKTGSGVVGEQNVKLLTPDKWNSVNKAAMSYGYSLNANLLQLAQGYTIFTANGRLMPATVFKQDKTPKGVQVIQPETAKIMREMLVSVTRKGGTGQTGAIEGIDVGAKTGTAKKSFTDKKGYHDDRYRASYIGFAPADKPRLIVAVMIDEPRGRGFYGGTVAGPVFRNVMSGSLQILDGQHIASSPKNNPVAAAQN